MAQITIKPQYEQFAEELLWMCRAKRFQLSEQAEALLRLAAESWFEEALIFRTPNDYSTPSQRRTLAEDILSRALADPHITHGLPSTSNFSTPLKTTSFHELLVALSDAAKAILSPLISKGF